MSAGAPSSRRDARVEILLALAYLPALFYASRFGGPVIEEALAPTVSDR